MGKDGVARDMENRGDSAAQEKKKGKRIEDYKRTLPNILYKVYTAVLGD